MTKRFARVDAPAADVLALYRDVESWPQWRPSINRVEVLERSDDQMIVRIEQTLKGRNVVLHVRYDFRDDGFEEHQIRGFARKWEANWRFGPAPTGGGTVIDMTVDFELGLIGLFLSRRAIRSTVDRLFDATAQAAGARLRSRAIGAASSAAAHLAPSRIRILETDTGLEVWLDDRRYIALPAD